MSRGPLRPLGGNKREKKEEIVHSEVNAGKKKKGRVAIETGGAQNHRKEKKRRKGGERGGLDLKTLT